VEAQADGASAADTIPPQQSEPQTAHEDGEEMTGQLIAELALADDCVQAEDPWHSANADG